MADETGDLKRNILTAVILLLGVYVISIYFYNRFENWSYLDAAYFTTVTVTTIGYGDLVPRTDIGKIYTILLAFSGISLAFYLIARISLYREKTLDKHMLGRLNILRDLMAVRGKPKRDGPREREY